MASHNQKVTPFVLNNYISVRVASKYSGYSLQYLRRLLRNGRLEGIKIGQLWLGEKVLSDKQRRTIDSGYKRQLSVFQLG